MSTEDPQEIWNEYYRRKKIQRMDEADQIWVKMQSEGINDATTLALDFVHFGSSKSDISDLATQLAENYEMQVISADKEGYWLAKGTTRPYGVTLSKDQLLGWVEFMSDVAQSYACMFSTWALEAPSLGVKIESDIVENIS
jgi:hypothetical protein